MLWYMAKKKVAATAKEGDKLATVVGQIEEKFGEGMIMKLGDMRRVAADQRLRVGMARRVVDLIGGALFHHLRQFLPIRHRGGSGRTRRMGLLPHQCRRL